MKKEYPLGRWFGLHHTFVPSAIFGSAVLGITAALAFRLIVNTWGQAIAAGLFAVPLHRLGELWHQHGHARAARKTGHPMTGIRLFLIFGNSLYPPDEPELPARTHIRRALGGMPASLLLAAITLPFVLWLRAGGGLAYALALFFFLENLLFFGLGALLPLGFTDGITLLKYWGKR
jgi:hypothetical protein